MLVANKRPVEYPYPHRARQSERLRLQSQRQAHLAAASYKLKLFAAVFICALMAIAVITHYIHVINITQQVEQARSELVALQEEGKHLKLEIASLRSPDRLEQKAYELGMQYPGREQMIVLNAGAGDN
ncbi:MAG: cell division protein FtsL [Firmicutes bacterium]|nr:cell division protein FtsL [Bacillota bacterium]